MICKNCGAYVPDNSTFCGNCGQKTDAGVPQYGYAQPPYSAPANSLTATQKRLMASPVALVGIIAYTVQLVLSPLAAASASSELLEILDEIEGFETIADGVSRFTANTVATSIVSMIPAIIMAIGMWLVYASAKSKTQPRIKTAGLTMNKVITIINLVCLCIVSAILAVVILLVILGMFSSGETGAAVGVFIIMLFPVAAIVLAVIFIVKCLKTIGAMTEVANTGNSTREISTFVAVIMIVIGAFDAISALTSITHFMTFLDGAAAATSGICFGIFLFKYRNGMRACVNGGYAPAGQYSGGPAPYQPPQQPQPYQNQPYQNQPYQQPQPQQPQQYQSQPYQAQPQQPNYQGNYQASYDEFKTQAADVSEPQPEPQSQPSYQQPAQPTYPSYNYDPDVTVSADSIDFAQPDPQSYAEEPAPMTEEVTPAPVTEQVASNVCPVCGAQVSETSAFCSSCGAKLK